MSRSEENAGLVRLSQSGQTVADQRSDVRGRHVVDVNGEDLGHVDDLLLDEHAYKVRFLWVTTGGFLGVGATHVLVPVEEVEHVDDDTVRVCRERERLGDAPGYDPALADDPAYYARVYGWWGREPPGGPGATSPHPVNR